jgi:hypothetical protein
VTPLALALAWACVWVRWVRWTGSQGVRGGSGPGPARHDLSPPHLLPLCASGPGPAAVVVVILWAVEVGPMPVTCVCPVCVL